MLLSLTALSDASRFRRFSAGDSRIEANTHLKVETEQEQCVGFSSRNFHLQGRANHWSALIMIHK